MAPRKWTDEPGVAFALAGLVSSLILYFPYEYSDSKEGLYNGVSAADLAVFDIGALVTSAFVSMVAGGVIGIIMWRGIVGRVNRWSVPIRGAIAGGFTGLVAIPVAAFLGMLMYHGPGNSGIVLSLGGAFVAGLLGPFLAGPVSIPIGAFTGYALGLRHSVRDETMTELIESWIGRVD